MSLGDKIKHAAEEAVGTVKETVGKVTGNDELEARGKAEKAEADVKQAGDTVKDKAETVKDKAKDVFGS
ncbi:uncharacterized protein YjbJ (UPF0337 family) [Nakamurella sp. UYEF19]|uniref:CsbD family protein n=1 Tax=Nakamurella sp. UYEF19 TaxID=1756392 RepID=UPI0033998130